MTPDQFNTALIVASIGGLGFVAKTLWRTVNIVERLDERTGQHEKRIDNLEKAA